MVNSDDPIAQALATLAEMEAICEAATEGPWEFVESDPDFPGDCLVRPVDMSTETSMVILRDGPMFTNDIAGSLEYRKDRGDYENFAFIAAARTFGPAAIRLAKGLLGDGHVMNEEFTCGSYLSKPCDCTIGKLAREFNEMMKEVGDGKD